MPTAPQARRIIASDIPRNMPLAELLKTGDDKVAAGNSDEALAYLDAAVSRNPKSHHAYLHRGKAYLSSGKTSEGQRDLVKVLQLKPDFQGKLEEQLTAEGKKKLAEGHTSEAFAFLDAAVSCAPKNYFPYFHRGTAYLSVGQLDKGRRDIEQVLEINPAHRNEMEDALIKDATAKAASGNNQGALPYLDVVIAENPKNHRASFHRGAAYLALGKIEEARQDVNRVLELRPESQRALELKAKLEALEAERRREEEKKRKEEEERARVEAERKREEEERQKEEARLSGRKRMSNRSLGRISPEIPRAKRPHTPEARSRSPSLPDMSGPPYLTSPSAIESATKERASHLFDSSPSTRGYSASPEVDQYGSPLKKPRVVKKPEEISKQFPSPASKGKQPHQPALSDPSQKASDKSPIAPTLLSKQGRTPTASLGAIKEFSSPEDSALGKKGRHITDVGAPERGVKSSKRDRTPEPKGDRTDRVLPVTPTPSSRRKPGDESADAQFLSTQTPGQDQQAKVSPWRQVNEGADRSLTLSPAQRLRHSASLTEPSKQQLGEQRSPSVTSDRLSGTGLMRQRTYSALSDRSATPPLRRVDRSASGDLRAAAKLGEAKARDRQPTTPDTSDLVLTAGATGAALAGIASASKDDSIRGPGKLRAAPSMPDVFVSFTSCCFDCTADQVEGSVGRGPGLTHIANATT